MTRRSLPLELGSTLAGAAVAALVVGAVAFASTWLLSPLDRAGLLPTAVGFLLGSSPVIAAAFAITRHRGDRTGRIAGVLLAMASPVTGALAARSARVLLVDGWLALLREPLPAPPADNEELLRLVILAAFGVTFSACRWAFWANAVDHPVQKRHDAVVGCILLVFPPLGGSILEGLIVAAVRRAIFRHLDDGGPSAPPSLPVKADDTPTRAPPPA